MIEQRILVTPALPACEAVLIADASHEVLQASDPGPGLLSAGGDQVERLQMVAVVDTETAVGVEAVLCVALEYL